MLCGLMYSAHLSVDFTIKSKYYQRAPIYLTGTNQAGQIEIGLSCTLCELS